MIDCCDYLKDWKYNVTDFLSGFKKQGDEDLYKIALQMICHAALQCMTGSSSMKRKQSREGTYLDASIR